MRQTAIGINAALTAPDFNCIIAADEIFPTLGTPSILILEIQHG